MALILGLGGVVIVLGTVAGIVVGRLQTGRETEYRREPLAHDGTRVALLVKCKALYEGRWLDLVHLP